MPYYRFKDNDLFYNRIKAHPQVSLVVYSGSIYYNNRNLEPGAFTSPVLHMPKGHISLYEINVDRPEGQLVYPFITKGGSITSFKTVTKSSFNKDFAYGVEVSGTYPLSASISRDYISSTAAGGLNKRRLALKNIINFYRPLSPHFQYSGAVTRTLTRDLGSVNINLISIPSIFYGSSIKKGSIDLKFYVTGTLIAQAKDEKRNGELIQTGPVGSDGSGSCVGIALYNEGFFLLTGSTSLGDANQTFAPVGSTTPSWLHFATTGSSVDAEEAPQSSSFYIDFEGTNHIPTLTMMAHAPKGKLNHSNNQTFLDYDSYTGSGSMTGTFGYTEPEYTIKNIIKSPYNDPTASFQRQTYISRIGIYDKDKNLIAIAKVATPVRKRETDSFTFKLKMDF
tara:strand:- start:254 stop:1435 length:1182 start_codon:yes stop_codon:yes gene_type:complete